jgi:DNA invertase Pin-like site-specific DNA recombinase
MMSNALVTILGMVAEMEKNTMSLRIKQSLEGKKSDLARQGYFFNKAGEPFPKL